MSAEENQYVAARREKVARFRAQGIDPFSNRHRPTHWACDIHQRFSVADASALEQVQERVAIAGRLMAIRSFGKSAFFQLRDRTGEIQVFAQKNRLSEGDFALSTQFDVGDFVWVEGVLFRTKTGELSVNASQLRLVTKTIRPLPEKWHGLTDVEVRYRQRYVDLIANEDVRRTFVVRSQVVQAVRDFLLSREFLEVETPMMHPIPGGAAARPFVTHHNKLNMDLYLRIAPELYLKRLVVGGFERVFEINRNFRNEGISIQHNPEFTMLEFYQSYATYEDLMDLTEQMLSSVAQRVLGTTDVIYQGETLSFSAPFRRMTLQQSLLEVGGVPPEVIVNRENALQFARSIGDTLKSENEGLGAILTEIFELTVEKQLIQPTFITGFPTEVSPLARRNDANPEITDRFELYVYGREIANAFSELNDPEDQADRFRRQGEALHRGDDEAMHYDADYICALEHGMPPAAGEGIGIDRLVMLLTDSPSIRDVIFFPQLKQKEVE